MTRVTAVLLTHLVEAELEHLLSGQPRVLAEQELLPLALNLEGCGDRDSGAPTFLGDAVRVKERTQEIFIFFIYQSQLLHSIIFFFLNSKV